MKESQLRPCPFCSSDDIRLLIQGYGYSVDCMACGATKAIHSRNKEQVTASWNQRRRNIEEKDRIILMNLAQAICDISEKLNLKVSIPSEANREAWGVISELRERHNYVALAKGLEIEDVD